MRCFTEQVCIYTYESINLNKLLRCITEVKRQYPHCPRGSIYFGVQ